MLKVMFEVFQNHSSKIKKNKKVTLKKFFEENNGKINIALLLSLLFTNGQSMISKNEISKKLKEKIKELNDLMAKIPILNDEIKEKNAKILLLNNEKDLLKNSIKEIKSSLKSQKSDDKLLSSSLIEDSSKKNSIVSSKDIEKKIQTLVKNLSKDFILSKESPKDAWDNLTLNIKTIFPNYMLEIHVRTLQFLQNSLKKTKYKNNEYEQKIKFIQSQIELIYFKTVIDKFQKEIERTENQTIKNQKKEDILNEIIQKIEIQIITIQQDIIIKKTIKMSDNEPENKIINEQIINYLENSPSKFNKFIEAKEINNFFKEKNEKVKENIQKNNITGIISQISQRLNNKNIEDKYLNQIVLYDQTLLRNKEKSEQIYILKEVIQKIQTKENFSKISALINRLQKITNEFLIEDAAKELIKLENDKCSIQEILETNSYDKKNLPQIIQKISDIMLENFFKKFKVIEKVSEVSEFFKQDVIIYMVLLETINLLTKEDDLKDKIQKLKNEILFKIINNEYGSNQILNISNQKSNQKKIIQNLVKEATKFLHEKTYFQNENSFEKNKTIMLDVTEVLKKIFGTTDKTKILSEIIEEIQQQKK